MFSSAGSRDKTIENLVNKTTTVEGAVSFLPPFPRFLDSLSGPPPAVSLLSRSADPEFKSLSRSIRCPHSWPFLATTSFRPNFVLGLAL